jgi:hypothetical protein
VCLGVAVFVLAAAAPAAAQSMNEGPSPGVAALKSLVLPGWGQAANGKWLKGSVVFSAYAGFIGWGVALNQDVQDARGLGQTDFEIDQLQRSRNAKYWLAGLTALLSMADAYVDAHLNNFDERIDAEVGFLPTHDGPVLAFALTARLDSPRGHSR